MEGKLQLCVLMLHLHASLAVWQHITVMKGKTLNLHCPIKSQGHVEWRNPDGNIMFFNMIQVLRDKRYSLIKLTETTFRISISNVTFSDGGRYTCSHYLLHTVEKTVEVTVLDRPHIDITTHKGSSVIKCAAEGNYPPPDISWQIKNGPEFHYDRVTTIREDKKYVTIDMLYIKPVQKAIHVKCIARHPTLHSGELINIAIIRPPNSRKNRPKNPTNLPWTPTPLTLTPTGELHTEFSTTTLQFSKETTTQPSEETTQPTTELTSDQFPKTEKEALTTNDEETTGFPMDTPQFNNSGASTVDSTTQKSTLLNTTGNWLTSAALPANNSFNETKDSAESGNDSERQKGNEGNASLLVFLITCLILGLLVVVIFIGIKLRRAHIIWKRENDDTDTSEASSKSKSSQEDKNTQRRRGFFNTGLTQYVIQEPTVITSVTNPAAMTSPENMANEQNSPTQLPPQANPKSNVKETEL